MPTGTKHEQTMTGALRGGQRKKKDPTAVTIDLSEGEPVFLTIQQVRANLKRVCDGRRIVAVGNRYHPRAVIVPCGPNRYLTQKESIERWEKIKTEIERGLDFVGT